MSELIEPLCPYTGSKYKLLPQLLPLFPPAKRFVDLFAGGGSVYSNVVDKYNEILVNDIIADLIGLQQKLLEDPTGTEDEIISLKLARDDAEGYKRLRADYNENPTPAKLFMLMMCCTNNMLRFNKKFRFNQTHGKRTLSPVVLARLHKWVEQVGAHRNKIQFSAKPFHEVEVKDGDFVLCDPPYSLAEAGYNAYWNSSSDDAALYQYLVDADAKGVKFLVCGFERHGEQKSSFLAALEGRGFMKTELVSDYEHVSRKKQAKNTKEVVFTNYDPKEL